MATALVASRPQSKESVDCFQPTTSKQPPNHNHTTPSARSNGSGVFSRLCSIDERLKDWIIESEQLQYLLVSPYAELQHLLDPRQLEQQDVLLALALTRLSSSSEDYVTRAYEDSFDWRGLMRFLADCAMKADVDWRRREYYVVEFRSKLKTHIDTSLLFNLDKASHREAMQSGGLLKYWYGVPDDGRRNLATCLWRSKEDAIKGGRGPWHRQAMSIISQMYQDIHVRGLSLIIDDNVQAWHFSSYPTDPKSVTTSR